MMRWKPKETSKTLKQHTEMPPKKEMAAHWRSGGIIQRGNGPEQ